MTDRTSGKSWEELLWDKATDFAKRKAALMYQEPERRNREEKRIAHAEYLRLRYPS